MICWVWRPPNQPGDDAGPSDDDIGSVRAQPWYLKPRIQTAFAEPAQQMDDLRGGEDVALDRSVAAFPLILGHVRQGGERSTASNHDLGPVSRPPHNGPDPPIDLLLHLFPMLWLEGIGPNQPLGDSDRAEGERVDMIDGCTGGEDHLDAATTDVNHGGRAPLDVEMPGGAPEGQLGLLLTRDHVHAHLVLAGNLANEASSVRGFPHGTGRDRPQLGGFEAIGDRLHLAYGCEGPFDGRFRQPASPVELLAQADHLPLFIQNAVAVVVLNLGHGQADRVAANVDGSQAGLYGGLGGSHGLACRFH